MALSAGPGCPPLGTRIESPRLPSMRGKAPKPAPPSPENATLEPLEPLYTVADVAAHFRTGREQVHRWIRSGDLGARRIGKLVRIAPADLADFEERHRTAGARGN